MSKSRSGLLLAVGVGVVLIAVVWYCAGVRLFSSSDSLPESRASYYALVPRQFLSGPLALWVSPALAAQCKLGDAEYIYEKHAVFFSILLNKDKFDRPGYLLKPWHYVILGSYHVRLKTELLEMNPAAPYPGQTVRVSVPIVSDQEQIVEICP